MDAVEAESPHVVHGANLDVTTAMNVDAIKENWRYEIDQVHWHLLVINNETAMVGSSLGQVTL